MEGPDIGKRRFYESEEVCRREVWSGTGLSMSCVCGKGLPEREYPFCALRVINFLSGTSPSSR